MPYIVQELIEERTEPITAALDDRVQVALDKMLEHDFSQLPVVDHDDRPAGLITSESILRAQRNFGIGLDDLFVQHARVDADEFREDADLFELLDRLRDRYAVLIVDGDRKLTAIVTNYDTAAYFRRRAEDMMLVEDIESMLKDYIQAAYALKDGSIDEERLQQIVQQKTETIQAHRKTFQSALKHYISLQTGDNLALDADSLQEVLNTHYGDTGNTKTFSDLTFYEYTELLLSKEQWHRYQNVFKLDRTAVRTLLESVRVTRNALAHFQGEILSVQRERLRFCAGWLAQYEDAIAAQFGLDDQSQSILVSPGAATASASASLGAVIIQDAPPAEDNALAEDEIAPSESRYASLAVWLQGQPADVNLVKPKFATIEEIIGGPLPASAYSHRSWWSNDSVSHTQSQQWLGVDWRVSSVNLSSQTVRFTRIKERQKAYIEFFSSLLADLRAKADFPIREASPDGANWATVKRVPESSASVAGYHFSFARSHRFRVEFYIDTGEQDSTKQLFDLISGTRDELEATLGEMSWERIDHKRASRIALYHPGAITDDEQTLSSLRQWAVDTMIALYNAMEPVASAAIQEVLDL